MYIPKTGPWSDGDEFPDFLDVEGAPAVARRHLANFGGKGGGSQTQTQNTVSRTELPDWVTDAAKKNLAQAYTVSQNLMGPYAGQRVANLPPGLLADIGALQSNIGSTNPAFSAAQGTAAGGMGYRPDQVTAGALTDVDRSGYMNPYTQNVIGSGLQALDRQRQQAQNQNADLAQRAKAFGGTRFGVQQGVTDAAAARQAGQLASQLQAQNFAQATENAQSDLARNLQAQVQNQQANLSGANLNLNAANALGALASQGQNAFLQGTLAAMQGQQLGMQHDQAQLDAARQYYQEQQQFPIQQLQIPLTALGMTPYGTTMTTNSTLTTPTSRAQGGGNLLQGLLGNIFGSRIGDLGGGLIIN